MSDDMNPEPKSDQPEVAPVIATVRLTEKDIRAGLNEMGGSGPWRRVLFIVPVIAVVLTMSGRNGGMTSVTTLAPVIFMTVLYLTFLFVIPLRAAKGQIRNLERAGDTNVTYRFDDEGLTIRSSGASASMAYRRLVKSRRGKTTLLLFSTPQIAQIIPLRAFSADELERVLAFLPPDQKGSGIGGWKRVALLWVVVLVAFLAIWQFLNDGTSPSQSLPKTRPPGDVQDVR